MSTPSPSTSENFNLDEEMLSNPSPSPADSELQTIREESTTNHDNVSTTNNNNNKYFINNNNKNDNNNDEDNNNAKNNKNVESNNNHNNNIQKSDTNNNNQNNNIYNNDTNKTSVVIHLYENDEWETISDDIKIEIDAAMEMQQLATVMKQLGVVEIINAATDNKSTTTVEMNTCPICLLKIETDEIAFNLERKHVLHKHCCSNYLTIPPEYEESSCMFCHYFFRKGKCPTCCVETEWVYKSRNRYNPVCDNHGNHAFGFTNTTILHQEIYCTLKHLTIWTNRIICVPFPTNHLWLSL